MSATPWLSSLELRVSLARKFKTLPKSEVITSVSPFDNKISILCIYPLHLLKNTCCLANFNASMNNDNRTLNGFVWGVASIWVRGVPELVLPLRRALSHIRQLVGEMSLVNIGHFMNVKFSSAPQSKRALNNLTQQAWVDTHAASMNTEWHDGHRTDKDRFYSPVNNSLIKLSKSITWMPSRPRAHQTDHPTTPNSQTDCKITLYCQRLLVSTTTKHLLSSIHKPRSCTTNRLSG